MMVSEVRINKGPDSPRNPWAPTHWKPLRGLPVFVGRLLRLLTHLQAAPYLAIELFQERVAALGTLLVVTHHPQILVREVAEAPGNLLHAQLFVALDGKVHGAQTFLSVRERDVEQLGVGVEH